jgi:SP family arabinose:H+ symporter-like MFS transporter
MNKILVWSLTAAMSGFLFGFDTVVISGVDQTLQALWGTSEIYHGVVVMGMALWGTVLGALFGGWPTDHFGRKRTLFMVGLLYFVSALGSGLAIDPVSFGLFRFIGGIGVGVSTIAAPAYISEIAPANKRGRLVALYQFFLVLGILMAFISNYAISGSGPNDWRWMMGVEAAPALIYTLFVLGIPYSPRWLIVKGRDQEAARVLQLTHQDVDPNAFIREIRRHEDNSKAEPLFQSRFKWPILLAVLFAFFNQVSGINAFLYYAPRIFEIAGLEADGALLSSIGIGLTNLVFTIIGMSLIDKVGRRTLMYIGSVGYIISLSGVSAAFFLDWQGFAVPGFLFAFIASHAIGQGAVIWVFISEIFTSAVRAKGQALGSSTHWLLAAAIPSSVPWLFTTVGPAVVFLAFAILMVGQLLFVRYWMPETKGVSLEDLGDAMVSESKQPGH